MSDEKPTSTPDGTDIGSCAHLANGFLVGGGRYSLQRELARGGMGVVWLAHDERLVASVALKFLSESFRSNPVAVGDLRRETQKSRILSHPNIIRIFDFYEAPGEDAFIAMEYVDGSSLWELRSRQTHGCFPWIYLKAIVRQLCEALDYAHSEGVIHRDLKPGNMLLDDRHRLRLADFGIAARTFAPVSPDADRLRTSGTIFYMSPQQLEGNPAQVGDDIYAFGATLYDLLSGYPPFYENDIHYQVLNVVPTPLSERLADLEIEDDVPADVAALIMACLSKDPDKRPASARAVADWIGLTEAPTPAPPSPAAPVAVVVNPPPKTVIAPVPSLPMEPTPEIEAEPETEDVEPVSFEENEARRRLMMIVGAIGVGTMAWLAWTHLIPNMTSLPEANNPATNAQPAAAASPVPSDPSGASVILGSTNQNHGMALLAIEGGSAIAADVDGKSSLLFKLNERSHPRARLYFKLLPGFHPDDLVHARLKIEYYAAAPGMIQVQYDAISPEPVNYKNGGRKEFVGDAKWKSAYFELENAAFHGGEYNGADFCLNTSCPELYLHAIRLTFDN